MIVADIKKPPVGYPMEADAVVALWPHSLSGYHLAQLQVGGALQPSLDVGEIIISLLRD